MPGPEIFGWKRVGFAQNQPHEPKFYALKLANHKNLLIQAPLPPKQKATKKAARKQPPGLKPHKKNHRRV
jgi:hypothetical protein